MNQARSTICKIFHGEPRSYTRFNLNQNVEGDATELEIKLASDMEEEAVGAVVEEHLNHTPGRQPYIARKTGHTPKTIYILVSTTLLIFIVGYLIGYWVHHRKDVDPTCSSVASTTPFYQDSYDDVPAPVMDWADVKELLAQKLSASNFDDTFNELAMDSHRAGSPGDYALANKVIKRFRDYRMKMWMDHHFIKVQDPPRSGFNTVTFRQNPVGKLTGYLSYSANANATGAILYAHYGRSEDFMQLQERNVNISGRVVLVRIGHISYAQMWLTLPG